MPIYEPPVDHTVNGATKQQIHFVETPSPGDVVLAHFTEPEPRYAVMSPQRTASRDEAGHPILTVRIASSVENSQASVDPLGESTPAVVVKLRGAQVLWRPGKAELICDPAHVEGLFSAVVEFAHYEQELRRLEAETAVAWPDLYEDKTLAFDVSPHDLQRSSVVGERMNKTLLRRIRLARLEPHLYTAASAPSELARKLGEELREKSNLESRADILDGQIEVFEGIYEMSSQRMGEYRASRQGHIMEWIIIVLLAAEILVMLSEAMLRMRT